MPGNPFAPTMGVEPGPNSLGFLPGAPGEKDPNIKVHLDNEDLWKEFNHIGTEMIITKMGR